MRIKDFFTTTYGEWIVFYRIGNSNWKRLRAKKGYWYADPIMLEYNEDIYLFTEAFENSKQIGRIAVSKFIDNEFTEPREIIRKPYHMSYPCVFVHNDKVYMIPETSQNRTLELYVAANDDLSCWEKKSVLAQNVNWVDTTVFNYKSKVFLITYIQNVANYTTKLFLLDMNTFCLTEINEFVSSENVYRPAGKVFESNGDYLRPVQYNKNSYGEKMRILRINVESNDWRGDLVDEISVAILGLDGVSKTHTYGKYGSLEVVDALRYYKTFATPYYVLRRKLNNAFYRIRNLYKDDSK